MNEKTLEGMKSKFKEMNLDPQFSEFLIEMYKKSSELVKEAAKAGNLKEGLILAGVASVPISFAFPDSKVDAAVEELNMLFAKHGHFSVVPKSRLEVDTALAAMQIELSRIYKEKKSLPETKEWAERMTNEFFGFAQGALFACGMDRQEAQFRATHMREQLKFSFNQNNFNPSSN